MLRSRLAALRSQRLLLVPAQTVATPTLVSCSPSSIPTAGGTACIITGTSLDTCSAVWFGGTPCTAVVPISKTQVTCVSPARVAGAVTIHVQTQGGGMRLANGVTYAAPTPIVLSIVPVMGAASGGTPVTITGSNFTGATGAAVGGVALVSFFVVNDTTITGTTGSHGAGPNDVTATNSAGTGTLVGAFTFVAAPTVASISTAGGTVGDTAGGYAATITGTNLTGSTGATFGGTAVTSYVVVNATTATCVVPAHATGLVAVAITGSPGGASTGGANAFEFYSPAQEVLSGFWRAGWASPELATASAGTSSTTGSLVAGTAPSFATLLNGLAVADFNGSTSNMTNPTTGPPTGVDQVLLSLTGGWCGYAIVNATTASASSASSAYNETAVWCDSAQGYQQLTYSTRGFTLSRYDGNGTGLWQEATVSCPTGGWHIVFFWWDGTNLFIQLDSAAPVTGGTLTSPMVASGASLAVGKNFNAGLFFGGKVAELAFAKSNLGATFRSKSKSYGNTRYALSL